MVVWVGYKVPIMGLIWSYPHMGYYYTFISTFNGNYMFPLNIKPFTTIIDNINVILPIIIIYIIIHI